MNEMIYTYDGSFEGFLCCIFDSYANKEVLTAITDDEDSALFCFPSGRYKPTAVTPGASCESCTSSPPTGRNWCAGDFSPAWRTVRFACTGWW